MTLVNNYDGTSTTLTYSGGLVTGITEAASSGTPRSVSMAYDGSSNLTLLTQEDGKTRSFAYDAESHLTSDQWDPYGSSFTYDSSTGLLININQGGGIVVTTIAATNETGLQTSPAMTSDDDFAVITDGAGDATTYQTDPQGALIGQVSANGGVQSWQLNGSEEAVLYTDDNGLETSYQYSLAGNMLEENDPDGSVTLYNYNAFAEVPQESTRRPAAAMPPRPPCTMPTGT